MSKQKSIRKPRKIAFIGKVKPRRRSIQKEKKIIDEFLHPDDLHPDELSKTVPVYIPQIMVKPKINKWLNFGFWFYIVITIFVTSVRFLYVFLIYVLGIFKESTLMNGIPVSNAEFFKLIIWIIYDLGLLFVLMLLYKKHWQDAQGKT